MSAGDYVRTNAEEAHQRLYEAREASRTSATVQIVYMLRETASPRDGSAIAARHKVEYRVVRVCGDAAEEVSAPAYRKEEAVTKMREGMWRDRMAAKRLGIGVHIVSTTRGASGGGGGGT
jgi:hypothetical protein